MKRRLTFSATALTIMALISAVLAAPSPTRAVGVTPRAEGAKQISGIGSFDTLGECTDPEGQGSDYALIMTGSLSGCHYVFVEPGKCSPGGAYYETGTEIFVGKYDGQLGTFKTTYVFTAKYLDCPNLAGEVTGRCQHPFVNGTGTGVFEGIKEARLDMRDDVRAGNFPYRGHLLF